MINALVEIEGASLPADKDVDMRDIDSTTAQRGSAPSTQNTRLSQSGTLIDALIEPAPSPLTPLNTQDPESDVMNLDPENAADDEETSTDEDSMYISSAAALSV